jgi:hypothetical protein
LFFFPAVPFLLSEVAFPRFFTGDVIVSECIDVLLLSNGLIPFSTFIFLDGDADVEARRRLLLEVASTKITSTEVADRKTNIKSSIIFLIVTTLLFCNQNAMKQKKMRPVQIDGD